MPKQQKKPKERNAPDADLTNGVRRHLRVGWYALFVFLVMGAALELCHGFKIPAYIDVSNHTRRLMWTLAHAHGALLGLINIAFAFTLRGLAGWTAGRRELAGRCLLAATVLMPLGFFMGGLIIYDGDPGLGVLLVPLGALLLFVSVFMTARAAGSYE